ncbi:MAG: YceD family protein [Peptococcales bacterium]|jgi:uncharacterized protein
MSLSINLLKVRNSIGTTASFELSTPNLPLTEELNIIKPVSVSLTVSNNGQILELKGNVNTEVESNCHRCLTPTKAGIDAVIDEKLVYSTDLRHLGDISQDEIEEKYLVFTNDLFDLTDLVRETIIMALPYKILCNDDCQGLCIKCGQNLNIKSCNCITEEIDPRLAILAKLKGAEEV